MKKIENVDKKNKKEFLTEHRLEILVAIFLGITALLMTWSSWIGALHDGNQAENYTQSNILASDANSSYNTIAQMYLADASAWNNIVNLKFDIEIAKTSGNTVQAELLEQKLDKFIKNNCSDAFIEAIKWAEEQGDDVSPFEKEDFTKNYFSGILETMEESQKYLEQGQRDNLYSDAYGLASVTYSVVLFILGIIGTFKNITNRKVLLIISIIALVLATIYMLTIPLPTDFDMMSYLNPTNYFNLNK